MANAYFNHTSTLTFHLEKKTILPSFYKNYSAYISVPPPKYEGVLLLSPCLSVRSSVRPSCYINSISVLSLRSPLTREHETVRINSCPFDHMA